MSLVDFVEIVVGELIPSDIVQAFSDEAIIEVVANIANGARDEWIRLAGSELHTSRRDYINSIQPVEHHPGVSVISLVGQPANLIEHGADTVDLRDWLLGPNVPEAPPGSKGKRRAKAGHFYRAIPFRHGTPGTGGAVGSAMGDPYKGVVGNAAALGRAVYKRAKELKPGETLPSHMRYGRGGKSVVPKLHKRHSVDIYAGMRRARGAYSAGSKGAGVVQSSYITFRMISENSPSDKWIRPATQGINLVDKVQEYVSRAAPLAFQAYVDSLGDST
jgi:hypothetical protein